MAGKSISGMGMPDIRPLEYVGDLSTWAWTGTVVAIQSRNQINSTTSTSTTGGGGLIYQGTGSVMPSQTHTSVSTRSTEAVRYFVKNGPDEWNFELFNPGIAIREGNMISTIYAGNRKSSTSGWLVALANHDSRQQLMLSHELGVDRLIKRSFRLEVGLILLLAIAAASFVLLAAPSFLYVFLYVALAAFAAVVVLGFMYRHRADRKEKLIRDYIVAEIDSKLAKEIADVSMARAQKAAESLG